MKKINTLIKATALCLMFLASTAVSFAQNFSVSGTVLEADGQPLPGATVLVEGSTRGVITDVDGSYTIDVAPTGQLTFSFIGMEPQTVSVANRSVVNVTLESSANQLDNVTVVAFGTQKKESVVSSITTVSPDELQVPSSNLTTAFAGRIAGMISYQRSGEPGQNNADFFVRGVTTFGTGKSDPLILIDNIELSSNDLARLNPDDIQSFSVLKDAAATALYGSRGANGIIMVTTKEGREGKAKISARFESAMSQNTSDVDVADGITFMKMHNEAVSTRDPLAATPYSDNDIESRELGVNEYVYPVNDWQELLFRDYAINTRANMSVSGGGSVAQYYVALTFSRDNGILNVSPVNDFNTNITLDQYAIRSNVNINLTKTTKLSVRFQGTFDDYIGPTSGGEDLFNMALKANPVLFPAYYPEEADPYANHVLFGNTTLTGGTGDYVNPYAEMVSGYKEYQSTMILAQLELEQDLGFITEGLKGRAMFNTTRSSYFDMIREFQPFYYDVLSYDKLNDAYTLEALNPDDGTDYLTYSESNGTRTVSSTTYFESALMYNRTFGDIHDAGAMLVFTVREELDGNASTLETSLPYRNISLAGRFTYGLMGRYFFEGNFGYNGSERFSEANRWGFFPSGGLGWMVSNEDFWANSSFSKVMPVFKLKATYGLVGNDDISDDRFFYLSEINMNASSKAYTFGDEFGYSQNGISISRYADDNITWEVSRKLDVGFEMNLYDRLTIQADYFSEVRTNILQTRSDVPSVLGLQATPQSNIGEAFGSGWEFSVDYSHIFSQNAWMQVMGNFTYAASVYTIYEEPDYSDSAPWLSRENQKISQKWGLIAERLFVDEEEVANSPIQQFGTYGAGDIKYTDINGDGYINEEDFVPIGLPTTPEIIYGFGISAGVGQFDMSVFFQGSSRSSFWIDAEAISPFVDSLSAGDGNNAVLQVIADSYWSESNQDVYAFWPRLSEEVMDNNTQTSTWYMRDGSFLRLKSAEFGYTIPYRITQKINMETCRFYVSGTNLFILSAFDTWDTEMGGDGLGYPVQRVYNVGVQIGF